MRYKIFVTPGDGSSETFYCEQKGQADTLFNMAVRSKMFSVVALSESIDEDFMVKEWDKKEDADGCI